ncbi:hypothetical protein ABZP36_006307 [Zizania latifolia]
MAASVSENSSCFQIVLGSSSPARREILADMGYEFTVVSADIDERAIRKEEPEELVKALAEAKVMVSKGVIRERPKSREEAREFIKGYSGDRAFAVNYVLVTNLNTGASIGGWDIPEICFNHIPYEFIENVVKEGDMTCVAGGLKLTHPSVSPFIKQLVGTVDSVRGLPRELTEKLIQELLGTK